MVMDVGRAVTRVVMIICRGGQGRRLDENGNHPGALE
jgi:hypothetical protein